MIVVDTSAMIAILRSEPEADAFNRILFEAKTTSIAAPTAFEFLMVAEGQRPPTGAPIALLQRSGMRIEPWTEQHLMLAREAFARYGKGQGHPAQLNFGDCMSYALAKSLDAPLLFKGDDFRRTDIVAAL